MVCWRLEISAFGSELEPAIMPSTAEDTFTGSAIMFLALVSTVDTVLVVMSLAWPPALVVTPVLMLTEHRAPVGLHLQLWVGVAIGVGVGFGYFMYAAKAYAAVALVSVCVWRAGLGFGLGLGLE